MSIFRWLTGALALLAFTAAQADKTEFERVKRCAHKGMPRCELDLGVMYYSGNGTRQDKEQAVRWFRKAAETGLPEAQHNLGLLLESGDGVQADAVEAVRWYEAAAEAGFAPAQINLALMHGQGKGVPQNFVEAYTWCNIAAAFGSENGPACRELFEPRLSAEAIESAQQDATARFREIQAGMESKG